MKDFIVSFVSRAIFILILVQTSTTQSNTPNDPLWDPFVKALSSETGRTVQDLNTLGLNDPNILKLWTYYSTNVQNLVAKQQQQQQPTVPTTTPPPLPDLYQPAYAFSANNVVQSKQANSGATTAGSGTTTSDANSALYNQLFNLVKGMATGPGYSSLIQQMSGSMVNPSQASPPASTPTQVSYQSLVDQYRTMMSSNPNTGPMSTSTSTSNSAVSQINYQSPIDRSQNTRANNVAISGAASGPVTSAVSTASSSSATSGQAPLSFEEQLQTYFPQFVSLFPTSSGGAGSTSGVTSSPDPSANSGNAAGGASPANTEQMIFDALLFGDPPKPKPQTSAATSTSTSSSPSAPSPATPSGGVSPAATNPSQQSLGGFMNMISGKANNGGNPLTNHIENVMKTRASRDMGCRFLPELLDMDLMPHSPINCLHKCPPPYINSQRFGIYCLCCPPGVNSNVANVMSIFKRASYMESPFAIST